MWLKNYVLLAEQASLVSYKCSTNFVPSLVEIKYGYYKKNPKLLRMIESELI